MRIEKIPFEDIPHLSERDRAYVMEDPALRPFYKYPVKLESFPQIIEEKKKQNLFRKELVEVLTHQYARFSADGATIDNITALARDDTFTLVTAHQPSLFTGPLYYIIKIISTINLSNNLNEAYPDFHFVPVFITGGEDHDFEEINHIHLFGKTMIWENNETGPVGAMSTGSLRSLLAELKEILGESEAALDIFRLLQSCYTRYENYADATIAFTHEIFKGKGLVIINMNDVRLKKLFIPLIKEEIFNRPSESLIDATCQQLAAAGYRQQALPREINFFYIREQLRERIVFDQGKYTVLNTDYHFSKEEMIAEIEQHPERFSPNVVMRPIYQEFILPNLAYIGGGGELAYWLERKSQFEHFGINYPMLIRRNSLLWIDKGMAKKIQKFGFSVKEIFQHTDKLIKKFVHRHSEQELSFNQEKKELEAVFERVVKTVEQVDKSLKKTALAEQAKQLKSLEQLETRVIRAEKQKYETTLNQIRAMKDRLFPNGGLQERYENLIPFYLKYQHDFFDTLFKHLHPLEKKFVVVIEE